MVNARKPKSAGPAGGRADGEFDAYLRSVVCFEPPPRGFDPRRATERELSRYGFPPRPDRHSHPRLWGLWERAYARPLKFIRAKVAIDGVLLGAVRRRAVHDGRFAPTNWAGAIARTKDYAFNPPEPARMVYADWAQPPVKPDFSVPPKPTMTVGFWVGLDGSGNSQVLQAGTATTVTGESIDNWAWYEWWPNPPIRIANFPVDQGDTLSVLVCAPQVGRGFASFLNHTTNVTTNIGFDPPGGVNSLGETAEWAVEGISEHLPNFVIAGFHECAAGTETHDMPLGKATRTEIQGASSKLTTTVILESRDTVVVLWEGDA